MLLTISNFYCIQVHDIAFAPNVGRSYFILGVATNKDLRIISIKNTEDGTKSDQSSKYTVRFTCIAIGFFFSKGTALCGGYWLPKAGYGQVVMRRAALGRIQ